MPYISLNPATNKIVKTYTSWDSHHLATALQQTDIAEHFLICSSSKHIVQVLINSFFFLLNFISCLAAEHDRVHTSFLIGVLTVNFTISN